VESRKWEGIGPALPTRAKAPHSIAQLPQRKFVAAAYSTGGRHAATPQPKKTVRAPDTENRPKSVIRRKWSVDELERLILTKINERLVSNNGAVFQAFRLFNEDGGEGDRTITKEEFRSVLSRLLQCEMTWDEVAEVFDRYDRDGNGDIDIFEFIEGVMRPFNMTKQLAGSEWDAKDASSFEGSRITWQDFKPSSSPPPRVPKAENGVNHMLRCDTPPCQDPDFKPATTNQHPHANLLRAATPDSPHPGLSPYAVAGCISDAEREMAEAKKNLMNFAFMYNTTQALRPLRKPFSKRAGSADPSEPWRPFRPC